MDDSTTKKRRLTRVKTECKVCGGSGLYSYFGVIACIPCKMFFKRNAENGLQSLKCNFDGNCDIDFNNRHTCCSCRLKKCFQVGMEIERMRSSVPRTKKTSSTTWVKINTLEQFPTLNLLRADQSTLTTDQWNLISNISHCYDEYSGLAMGEQFMREQNGLPLKLRLKPTAIIQFTAKALDGLRLVYEKNRDFISLPCDDRSILLQNTLKDTGCLVSHFISYKVGMTDSATFYETIELLSNPAATEVTRRLRNQFDEDITVHKLLLAFLSFSTVRHTVYSNIVPVNLSNIKSILTIQDTYVELLWRYLLYRNPFEQAVRFMTRLVRCLLTIHEMMVKVEEVQWYTDQTNDLVRQTEENLAIDV